MELPKIWLMRQAGRYLPEYQEVRKKISSFLELCYDPENAAKVTMQPIERFDLSAAIVFSDILVTADSLGIKVEFKEGIGPIVETITSLEKAESLKITEKCEQFNKIRKTIEIIKTKIDNKPIIGFVGGAWTVCAYILEGRGKTDFKEAVKMTYTNPKLVQTLINKITEQNIYYLKEQIRGGAEIIQIFESHAGIVPSNYLEEIIIKPTNLICQAIKKEFPKIKIIGFPRGSGYFYDKFINETDIDIIGCDQHVPIQKMKEWQNHKVVQGNLDPLVLFSDQQNIKTRVDYIMQNLDPSKLIFNLGHGILPNTPVDNVKFLVDYVKSWK
jgi:uroporphyrinogen decarboxylase